MSRTMLLPLSVGVAWLVGFAGAEESVPARIIEAPPGITPPAQLNFATTDLGFRACVTAETYIDYCLGYYDARQTLFTKCLCCSGTTLFTSFDRYAQTCASYLQTSLTESTSERSFYSSLTDYCQRGGAICAGGAAVTAFNATTASASRVASAQPGITSTPGACTSVGALINGCIDEDPNFLRESEPSQAACLCYVSGRGSTTWQPDVFDNYAGSCASGVTGNPSIYSAYASLTSFCHSVGDVLSASGGITGSPSSPASRTSLPTVSQTSTPTTGAGATAVTVTITPSAAATSNAASAPLGGQKAVWLGIVGSIVSFFAL